MVHPNSPRRRLEVAAIRLRYQNEKRLRRMAKNALARIRSEHNALLLLCSGKTCRPTDCQRCTVGHRLAMLDTWTASLCFGSRDRRTP